MPVDPVDVVELKQRASQLFSPRTPISRADLFAGRAPQIMKMIGAINQPGAHAIIYGERGVGKTSLANVAPLSFMLGENNKPVVAPRINCDGTDDFEALWRKVFAAIRFSENYRPIGFNAPEKRKSRSLLDVIGNERIAPGVVQRVLSEFGGYWHLVVILDEFDRLPDGAVPRLVADTIKSLSDSVAPATLVVVGVGDSVATLVRGHESVRRHLVEVPLPRMSRDELEKIIADRVPQLELSIDTGTLRFISLLSRGLPYYTHLLGQHAACAAIDVGADVIEKGHVQTAMQDAIDDSEREMQRVYYEATKSRQPQTLYAHSLAACSMALKDDFGCFTAADVRGPMSAIIGRPSTIPNFAGHLERFTDKSKGGILQSIGSKHSRRYRFSDPLMEPFVVIKSLADGVMTTEILKALSQPEHDEAA